LAIAIAFFWHTASHSGSSTGFGVTLLVAAAIEIVKVVVAVWPFASVTRTVIAEEPDEVGVPEIAPVLVFRVTPAGKVPVVTANEYGSTPRETVKFSEYAVPAVPVIPEVGVVTTGVVVIA
jgi:hypothetical protein